MRGTIRGQVQRGKIAAARQEADERFGDKLALQALERAREMAARQGWVRVKLAKTTATPAVDEPLGSDVYVPTYGQEVGSGSRPSWRDPKPFGDLLKSVVRKRGWASQIEVASVAVRWPQIVGPAISENCVVESFDQTGVLTLRASSTAWKVQMDKMLGHLDRRLQEELGPGVVKEIIINGPNVPSWKHGPLSVPGRGPRDTYG